ncbi:pyridoxal phosphate-dependent aminotransferase [Heliorestis convoluta]|uniref:Aminotransferase n=1 Tax=Heliorestis convoluta TaxID=356322 RepID=A0A5Q2MWU9_9FIRM|nr:aminotransferase class I/II-fold pyridoxal phosphate-dependent enzyme [Heliorestis convoluta]QGG46887.1 aminotransferase class I/II-fold pyridoxal phosphate-dependent enzyme [Heliorestis convoluta]
MDTKKRPYEHGGDIWSYGEKVIDFSANINAQGLSLKARKAMVERIDEVIHYPDPHCRHLLQHLSTYLGLTPSALLPGNGAVDLLDHWIAQCQLRKVMLCEPSFGQYHRALKAQGTQIHPFYLNEKDHFQLDHKKWIAQLIESGCDGAIVCSPHNPVGWTWERGVRDEIIKVCEERRIHLLIDESFVDFLPPEQEIRAIEQTVASNYVRVLYSLTKFFAIPGLRLGLLIGKPSFIEELQSKRDPWSVNHLAQIAAVAALQDRDYQKRTQERLPQERAYLFEGLQKIKGFEPLPSTVNFLLVNIEKSGYSASWWTDKLAQKKMILRNCNSFALLGERYLRIAVRTIEETAKLLEALQVIEGEESVL